MTYRPSFTEVTLSGNQLVIEGRSPQAQFQIAIQVTVVQGGLYGAATADAPIRNWTARIPVAELKAWPRPDLPDDEANFVPPEPAPAPLAFDPTKPLELFGAEIRGNPLSAIAWHQVKAITLPGAHPAPPGG